MAINKTIQTVERAFSIIESFDDGYPKQTVIQISDKTGIPRSTAHRFVSALVDLGYLEEDTGSRGFYKLGIRLFRIGSLVKMSFDIRDDAIPVMKDISMKLQSTVHLRILNGDKALQIHKEESPFQNIRFSHVGSLEPLHCTAAGKILLSGLTENEIQKLLPEELPGWTENTITDYSVLLREIEIIRERGWAKDNEELELGLTCIAVPIYGSEQTIIAAMSVSGLTANFTEKREKEIIKILKKGGMDISVTMGYIVES